MAAIAYPPVSTSRSAGTALAASRAAHRFGVALMVGLLALVTLGGVEILSRASGVDGQLPLPAPLRAPLPAPAPVGADFPSQSRIASCLVLATRSDALTAPRSARSADIVGPLYADACQA